MKQKFNNILTKLIYLTIIALAIYGLHTAHLDMACYSHADGVRDTTMELLK